MEAVLIMVTSVAVIAVPLLLDARNLRRARRALHVRYVLEADMDKLVADEEARRDVC